MFLVILIKKQLVHFIPVGTFLATIAKLGFNMRREVVIHHIFSIHYSRCTCNKGYTRHFISATNSKVGTKYNNDRTERLTMLRNNNIRVKCTRFKNKMWR